jgi:hypothetical protein
MQARVVDRKLEPLFKKLMLEHKYYEAARFAYALAVSHRSRRNHLDARKWGKACLQLLVVCSASLSDWERDTTPIILGGIDVPAPIYPDLVKKNFWWLLTNKDGKSL